MTRWEARALLAFALLALVGGLTWLLGPFGLIGAGSLLLVVVLFVIDVRERVGGETVEEPARAGDRYPFS